MKCNSMCALLVLAIMSLAAQAQGQEIPRRSPHTGELYQDFNYADAAFRWLNVGGWIGKNGSIPGFELDFTVDSGYYYSCSSNTNLPRGYSDCPTAGVLENDPTKITFGVGSYDARLIQPGTDYYAQWSLNGGSSQITAYSVGWQEVWDFVDGGYGSESPWHMDSVSSGVLMSSIAIKTQQQVRDWRWRDRSLAGTGASRQEPDGSYYYSSKSQLHNGTLRVPPGSDFDLYLYRWNGTAWEVAAQSLGTTSSETINYSGSPGYYAWIVYSYNGSGRYQLGMDFMP